MKVCKVHPSGSQCSMCIDTWESYSGDISQMPDCETCSRKNKEYEIIEFVNGFWGTFALLQDRDRKGIYKVSIDRIYDVHEA